MQQGWTVRSGNEIDLDEMNLDEVEFNFISSLNPLTSADQKVSTFFFVQIFGHRFLANSEILSPHMKDRF